MRTRRAGTQRARTRVFAAPFLSHSGELSFSQAAGGSLFPARGWEKPAWRAIRTSNSEKKKAARRAPGPRPFLGPGFALRAPWHPACLRSWRCSRRRVRAATGTQRLLLRTNSLVSVRVRRRGGCADWGEGCEECAPVHTGSARREAEVALAGAVPLPRVCSCADRSLPLLRQDEATAVRDSGEGERRHRLCGVAGAFVAEPAAGSEGTPPLCARRACACRACDVTASAATGCGRAQPPPGVSAQSRRGNRRRDLCREAAHAGRAGAGDCGRAQPGERVAERVAGGGECEPGAAVVHLHAELHHSAVQLAGGGRGGDVLPLLLPARPAAGEREVPRHGRAPPVPSPSF